MSLHSYHNKSNQRNSQLLLVSIVEVLIGRILNSESGIRIYLYSTFFIHNKLDPNHDYIIAKTNFSYSNVAKLGFLTNDNIRIISKWTKNIRYRESALNFFFIKKGTRVFFRTAIYL